MNRALCAVALPLALAACASHASGPAPRSTSEGVTVDSVQVDTVVTTMRERLTSSDDVAGFVPLVAAVDTVGGECVTFARPDLTHGERYAQLAFPNREHAARSVGVVVSADGKLLSINDFRHAPDSRGDVGPNTNVSIDLEQALGNAANMMGTRTVDIVEGDAEKMMTAENLGRPGVVAQMVLRRCGAMLGR